VTSTDDTATIAGAAAKGSAKSGTDQASDGAAKHSGPDPLSSALTLLGNALGGILAGAAAAVPTPVTQATTATAASSTSVPGSGISNGNGTASALATLLEQNLAADPGTTAANSKPAGGSPVAVTPAPATTAAAAALTAAQLTSGTPVASQQTKSGPTVMTVSSPVGSSAWTDEVGTKITWLAHQGIESASLQLSPEHLGPLQVTISVHNGQASVWFGAAQPDTRSALQQSLPQLRQLFANQGLTLADAGVSREPPRGQDRQKSGRAAAPVAGVTAIKLDASAGHGAVTGGLGLVDTYA
jgi:flagellar hook-length control protein FliK